MNISRRIKYENKGRAFVKTDQKIPVTFGIDVLDLFCTYILSENKHIRKSHLINLRNLILVLDMNNYKNDPEKMKRIDFITKGLEAKLVKRIQNPLLVIKYINGGIMDTDVVDVDNIPLLSTDELTWINETISSTLKYRFLYSNMERLLDIYTRFKAADYTCMDSIVQEFEEFVDQAKAEFRKAKVESADEMMFTLRPGAYEEIMQDTYDQLKNPSRRLLTGMQGLNEMLNGGFESGRVYMMLGTTGVGKSLLMLNLMLQMKKANKNYKAKDPGKIPVLVMLTQENSVRETIERIWNIVGFQDSMTSYTIEEVIKKLQTEGELYLSDDSPIDILIKYKANRSIDTGYLYTLCEDLEDEGYEVIAMFQDHVKRIRSIDPNIGDIRLELGEVVNEMKVFAQLKDIPVITISHLNRDAARIIDEHASSKSDITRMLGKANVGESMLMIDNLDAGFIINRDMDKQENEYLAIKRIKMREKATLRDYILYPFAKDNRAKLLTDIDSPVPLFRESIQELNNTQINRSISNANICSTISQIETDGFEKDDEMSAFAKFENFIDSPKQNNVITLPVEEPIDDSDAKQLDDVIELKQPVEFCHFDYSKIKYPDENFDAVG